MVSKVVVNGNAAEESKDIENDNIEGTIKTKSKPVLWELFTDPEIRRQYRRFCLEDTNVPLLMFMALVLIAGFSTRYCLQNFWTLNVVMIIAFVVGLISIIIGFASGAVRMAVWEPIASYPLLTSQGGIHSLLRRCRDFLQSIHSSESEFSYLDDLLMLTFPTACCLVTLGRALLPDCPAHVSAWDSQFCNVGGVTSIPITSTVLTFLSILTIQTLMRGTRIRSIIIAYVIQVILLNYSLYVAGSPLYPWMNLAILQSMTISYEIERHSRNIFLNQRDALMVSEAHAKLQLELAKRDLDSKRAMVRHISHEIRTPLNITAVGMDTMQRTLKKMPPSKLTGFLQEIVDSCSVACEDALTIVSELLDFEKLAAGMFTLEKVPTRLVSWVAQSVQIFRVSAESKGLKIDYIHPTIGSTEERKLVADIDPLKMTTVMRNLMSNAVKFSRPGGTITVKVGISTRRETDNTKTNDAMSGKRSIRVSGDSPAALAARAGIEVVTISVKDCGAGLSHEDLGRLFQEGVQINPNKLQNGGGSGFGLFITKGIVKLHDASIWAESEGEDKGTSFFVELLPSAHTAGMEQLLSLDLALALQSQRDSFPNPSEGDDEEEVDESFLELGGEGGGGRKRSVIEGTDYDISPLMHPDHSPGRHITKSGRDMSVHSMLSAPMSSGLTTPNDTARRGTVHGGVMVTPLDGREGRKGSLLVTTDEKKLSTDSTSPRIPSTSPTPRVKRLAYNNIAHPYNREQSKNFHHRPSLSMPDIGGVGNLLLTARGTTNAASIRGDLNNTGNSFNNNIARTSAGSRGSLNNSPHTVSRVSDKCAIQPLHILIVDDSMLNRRMINNCLKMDGHLCEEAEDGLEAVSRVIDLQQQYQQQQKQQQEQKQQETLVPSSTSLSTNVDIETGLGVSGPLPPIHFTKLAPVKSQEKMAGKSRPTSPSPSKYSVIFDVVLMDNQMPRMNGTTATQEMRRRGFAGVIIGITGDSDNAALQEFITAGANACLVKPISRDGLMAALVNNVPSPITTTA